MPDNLPIFRQLDGFLEPIVQLLELLIKFLLALRGKICPSMLNTEALLSDLQIRKELLYTLIALAIAEGLACPQGTLLTSLFLCVEILADLTRRRDLRGAPVSLSFLLFGRSLDVLN